MILLAYPLSSGTIGMPGESLLTPPNEDTASTA
jgi:hypothetical protein